MTDPWDKRKTMPQALSLVRAKGLSVAFGGVTLYRRPMAFALGLLKQFELNVRPTDLTLLSITAGLESDILIGAGLVKVIRTCYAGLEVFGLAPHFTQAISQGTLEMIEETEASFAYGLRASLAGVGFMPSTAWQATDLLKLRPDVKSIQDPYSGEMLTAFPAITPDVCIIHALEADLEGNALIGNNQGIDRELALAANTVIVTAEKIVERLDKADIIGPVVDAVIECPNGAWPTSCHPLYALDGEAVLAFTEASLTDDYAQLLGEWYEHHQLDNLIP
jgi:glutaconate CoA-transferase subunit A